MNNPRPQSEILRQLLAAEPLPGRRILLYGGGDALLSAWLAAEGAEVAILDSSRDAVLAAIAHVQAAGVGRRVRGVEISSADLRMFADLAFDLLVLSPGAPFDLAELARILRPGARLVSSVPLDASAVSPHFTALRRHSAAAFFRLPWSRPAPLFWTARRLSSS